jgi:hypothetical protein
MSKQDDGPAFEPLDDPDMDEMRKVAGSQGKGGDLAAIKLSWWLREREWGSIDLAAIDDLAGVQKAQAQVMALLNSKRMAPRAALTYARLIEYRRRAIVTIDHEARIREIEEKYDKDPLTPAGGGKRR